MCTASSSTNLIAQAFDKRVAASAARNPSVFSIEAGNRLRQPAVREMAKLTQRNTGADDHWQLRASLQCVKCPVRALPQRHRAHCICVGLTYAHQHCSGGIVAGAPYPSPAEACLASTPRAVNKWSRGAQSSASIYTVGRTCSETTVCIQFRASLRARKPRTMRCTQRAAPIRASVLALLSSRRLCSFLKAACIVLAASSRTVSQCICSCAAATACRAWQPRMHA